MRSSKSRSRSKSNRQRSIGNIINRVFDSSGPEGKVRGTPQQIIEKYLALARDAGLSNDRVAEQNFLQHAEHYTRMLGEAQAELAREQAARQAQMGQHGQQPHGGNGDGRPNQQHRDRYEQRPDRDDEGRDAPRGEARRETDEEDFPGDLPAFLRAPASDQPDDHGGDDGPGLVETPETREPGQNERQRAEGEPRAQGGERPPRPPRRQRQRRDEPGEHEDGDKAAPAAE